MSWDPEYRASQAASTKRFIQQQVIPAAIAVAVLGAGYLYYRHRESKKAEQTDREYRRMAVAAQSAEQQTSALVEQARTQMAASLDYNVALQGDCPLDKVAFAELGTRGGNAYRPAAQPDATHVALLDFRTFEAPTVEGNSFRGGTAGGTAFVWSVADKRIVCEGPFVAEMPTSVSTMRFGDVRTGGQANPGMDNLAVARAFTESIDEAVRHSVSAVATTPPALQIRAFALEPAAAPGDANRWMRVARRALESCLTANKVKGVKKGFELHPDAATPDAKGLDRCLLETVAIVPPPGSWTSLKGELDWAGAK